MNVPILHLHSPIELLVSRPAPVVSGDLLLSEVAAVMTEEWASAVLVACDRISILTERDMVRALAAEQAEPVTAAEAAAPVTVWVDAETDIVEACRLMLERGVSHLVVKLSVQSFAIVSIQEIAAVLVHAVEPDHRMCSLTLNVVTGDVETEAFHL